VIEKGIEGTTVAYNGTDYTYYGPADLTISEDGDKVVYDFKLRNDLTFSDGEKVTVDDVIFTMYVLSDPTYDGSSTFFALPIEGMEEYRSGMDSRMNLILKAGPDAYEANDNYTEEQYNAFWTAFDEAGLDFVKGIKDYLVGAGYNAEEDTVATWAANWGYEVAEDGTEADLWAQIVEKYGYDLSDDGINAEVGASDSISALILAKLGDAASEYQAGVQTGESAANISGIQKIDDYHMKVVLTKVDATAIYQLGVAIAPLHYYGDKAAFDYDANKFGFTKGDLSSVRAKTTQPLGAGPYKFLKY
jgi:peptide/nickel transport system substrate-binding protein